MALNLQEIYVLGENIIRGEYIVFILYKDYRQFQNNKHDSFDHRKYENLFLL